MAPWQLAVPSGARPLRGTLPVASTRVVPAVVWIVKANWSPSSGELDVAGVTRMLNSVPSLPARAQASTENSLPTWASSQPGPGVNGTALQCEGSRPGVVGTQPASTYSTARPASLSGTCTAMLLVQRPFQQA